jgi:hypothetical protein
MEYTRVDMRGEPEVSCSHQESELEVTEVRPANPCRQCLRDIGAHTAGTYPLRSALDRICLTASQLGAGEVHAV